MGAESDPWAIICGANETVASMQKELNDAYGGAEACEEEVVEQIQLDIAHVRVLSALGELALSAEELSSALEHLLTRTYLSGLAAARQE